MASGTGAPTPRRLGYFMPPEWHPHESTWLAWPTNRETWPGRVRRIQSLFLEMMRLLASGERIDLLVDHRKQEEEVRGRLDPAARGRVRFHRIATGDAWIRDYGPNFLIRSGGEQAAAGFNQWRFNAWGGRYPELAVDGDVPSRLAPLLDMPRFRPGLVLEGGAIDVDGRGGVLASETCLLNPNRNPGRSRKVVEDGLRSHLGACRTIWLGDGLPGDDTDGHVDNLARFVRPDTIVCAVEEDSSRPHHRILKDNRQRLTLARRTDGRRYRILTLPLPSPRETGLEGLPASYLNFYIANRRIMVPAFGCRQDELARKTVQELFPLRQAVSLNCRDLIRGLGGIHCITLQQPRAVRN